MYEQDCNQKILVITKFSLFLQTPNSNFRLSANRAICKIFGADFVIRIGYYAINYANL